MARHHVQLTAACGERIAAVLEDTLALLHEHGERRRRRALDLDDELKRVLRERRALREEEAQAREAYRALRDARRRVPVGGELAGCAS